MNRNFTIIFCMLSLFSFADGMHISGMVKDVDSKKPVRDAFVLIKFYNGFEFSDQTDSLGRFDIYTTTVVPEADYTLILTAKNYWEMSGFVHVTKECSRNFFIKSKTEETTKAIPVIKKETAAKVTKKDTVTILVGVADPLKSVSAVSPKTVLEGFAANNLVFLIDISSSMNDTGKMPLLKESMKYLVNELRSTDRVTILTFSNYVKEVLPSTEASDKAKINKVINGLIFGSTSQGGAALEVAYKTAQKNYIQSGNNRIVLASDGLFTSGEKDYKKMQMLIESGLDKNITLSVFCFGKNTEYVNTKLKKLTASGNGNFAIITNIDEAKSKMIEEAKAVKKK